MEVLLLLMFVVTIILYFFLKPKSLKGKQLPGPVGWPIIGSALSVNDSNSYKIYSKYAKQYGEIFGVKMLGTNVVCLNSAELIKKAFCDERYKRFFNDRESLFYSEYILYGCQSIAFYKEGFSQVHADMRKGMAKGLHVYGDGIPVFERKVMAEIASQLQIIEDFKGKEFDFVALIKRTLTNLISILLNGESLKDDDKDLDMFWEFYRGKDFMLDPSVNTKMVHFPFLRFLPGKYRDRYKDLISGREKLTRRFLTDLKKTYVPGKVRGLIDYLVGEQKRQIEEGQEIVFTDERIICFIVEMVAAGILTLLGSMCGLMLCLVNHPEYQVKIQQELDEVVGRDRLPTIEDRSKCPVFEAVAMEIERYITVVPLSLSHHCVDHVTFEGYDIQPKTSVVPNLWFVHHDEKVWGDPWTFRPERFLDDNGQIITNDHPLRKNWIPFSMGRRQCPGDKLAMSRLFLYIASMLQKFKFIPSRDKCGSCDPRLDEQFEIGVTCKPKPFFCTAEPRY